MKSILMASIAIIFSTTSFAQTGPGHQRTHIEHHPRVNEVNKREDKQEKRVTNERKEGDITKAQAHQDRKNLSSVNQEKKDMRKTDNGHLTKTDQEALNQQLNANSKKIGK